MKKTKKLIFIILSFVLAAVIGVTCGAGCLKKHKPNDEPPKDEEPPKEDPPVLGEPAIKGAVDVTVRAGTYYDFAYGVTAISSSGKDITANMVITGEVNTAKAGEYTLTYTVTDEHGKTATVDRVVTVNPNPNIGEVKPVPEYTAKNSYNIAKGCAATATNTTNDSAHLAFDGDLGSRWESAHGVDDVSLTVNLGAVLPFEAITIDWEAAYASDFEILISSDGVSYEQIASQINQTLRGEDNDGRLINSYNFEEDGYEAQYIRLHCTKRVTNYGYSVYEMQVFGKKGTVVPAEEYPVLFNAPANGYEDWAIVDEQWLKIDFGSVKSFNKMEIS